MKPKKNKKFYNFTEKQKRKDRSANRDLAPRSFRKIFSDEFNARSKRALYRNLNVREVEYPVFKKNVAWWYW